MEDTKPQFSVIVPVYNARDTIGACLAAARAQDGFGPGGLELIVVDDGSDDGSGGVAQGRCDRLVRLPANRGAAAARNAGVKEARAGVVVFVDADVALAPGALAAIRREFERDPAVAAVVGRYGPEPGSPGVVAAYHNAFTRYHHDLSPAEIDWFWGALGAVKKDAFWDAGGFDERYAGASAEDMELGLALSRRGHRTRYAPEAEGAHAHRFTLRTMLANDYKKAVLGTKLRLMGRLPRRAPKFVNLGNILTAPIVLAVIVLFAAAAYSPLSLLAASILIATLLVENERYYRYLSLHLPGRVDYALLLHWLQMSVIMAGAAAGVVGWILKRSPYGKPGWI